MISKTSGSTFPNLSKDKLNEFSCPLIPPNEQIFIILEIERIGWDTIKQQRDTILTLSRIELNDDGNYLFISTGTLT